MVCGGLYDHCCNCSAGTKIIRSGLSIYTGICWVLFTRSFSGFFIGNVLEKTTPSAGLAGALLTVPLAAILKFLPMWTDGAFPDYPFLDRMTIVFFLIVFIMVGISLANPVSEEEAEIHKIEVDNSMFKVSSEFIVGSFIICGVLVALYTVFGKLTKFCHKGSKAQNFCHRL